MSTMYVDKKPVLVFFKNGSREEMEIPTDAKFKASPYWFFGKKYRISVAKYGGDIASISNVDSYYFKGLL